MSSKSYSLTEGSIPKGMIRFAIPIFMGNLFQQLYNTADTLIVGRFLGSDALAAVGSSGSLIFLLVGFFNGIAIGAGVVIARYFGAQKIKELRRSIHTTILFGVLCGLALTILGLFLAPLVLRLMNTPESVFPQSITYFRIYFCGSLAFVLYNNFVGIMQSVGDSRHPLYYLVFSSVLNILLDVLFIGVFGYGVGAAAFATIISQFASAFLCFYRLWKLSPEQYRISFSEMHMDLHLLKQIVSNGVPTGFQNSIISIANVFVQANINAFGSLAVAGCGIYSKIEGFGFLPVTAFSMAITTYISQNLGAKKYDRVKKCGIFGILTGITIAEIIGITNRILMPFFASLFTSDPGIAGFTIQEATIIPLFFFLCAYSHCVSGLLRGAGKSAIPMYVMLAIWCVVRVSYISIIVRFIPKIHVIFWAYPLTWTLSSIIFSYFLLKTDWVHGYQKEL